MELTTWRDGVVFQLNPSHGAGWRAWTKAGSDDAWLGHDTNGNGRLDDGAELFGDSTAQPAPAAGQSRNGFAALAHWDKNQDQLIDRADWIYPRLQLWQDLNHDGVSQAEELRGLEESGVQAISVRYQQIRKPDGNGNLYRYSAPVTPAPGAAVGMTAWDVTLTSPTSAEREDFGLPEPATPEVEPLVVPPPRDDTQLAMLTAPDDSTARALPKTCLAGMAVAVPRVTALQAHSHSYWFPLLGICPTAAAADHSLFNKLNGTWRLVDNTVANLAPNGIIQTTKLCNFTHATIWYADLFLLFPLGWDPPFDTWETDAAILQCSAFSKPAPPCN